MRGGLFGEIGSFFKIWRRCNIWEKCTCPRPCRPLQLLLSGAQSARMGFCTEVSRSHCKGGTGMFTSTLLFALLSVPGAADTPTWSTDYQAARKESATTGKPLAVFLGTGKAGYEKLARDGGELSAECRRHLASHYVCVYVDTSTESGKRLADALEMPGGQGLVLSDRTGAVQAFRHEGSLTNAEMSAYLERYSG